MLANANLTTGVFSTVLIVVVILSAVFLIVFLKMVARNKASSQSFDHELNDKLTDERKLEKARWSNDLQLEYQAKEKLIVIHPL